MAVEFGAVTPFTPGWDSDLALESNIDLMRKYGLEGGNFWRWTNLTDAEDADPGSPYPVKCRGTAYRYTPVADVVRRKYGQR